MESVRKGEKLNLKVKEIQMSWGIRPEKICNVGKKREIGSERRREKTSQVTQGKSKGNKS